MRGKSRLLLLGGFSSFVAVHVIGADAFAVAASAVLPRLRRSSHENAKVSTSSALVFSESKASIRFREESLDEIIGNNDDSTVAAGALRDPDRQLSHVEGEKRAPDKGNPHECDSVWEHWEDDDSSDEGPPCREITLPDPFRSVGQNSSRLPGWDDDDGRNVVRWSFYLALRPERPAVGKGLKRLILEFMNGTAPFVVISPEELANARTDDDNDNHNDDSTPFRARPAASPQQATTTHGTSGRVGNIEIFLRRIKASVFAESEHIWWWEYIISFACYWEWDRIPVYDQTVLDEIYALGRDALYTSIESGRLFQDLSQLGPEGLIMDVAAVPPIPPVKGSGAPGRSGDGNATTAPTPNPADGIGDYYPSGTYSVPLDPAEWDWQRYLGLGGFLGTLLAACVLTHAAASRRRRHDAAASWGNLATEEGVNELLKTGWKVRPAARGDRQVLEVFDKANLGYTEGDSMFLGGYEQREAKTMMVGTTATQDSVTLPSNRHDDEPGARPRTPKPTH